MRAVVAAIVGSTLLAGCGGMVSSPGTGKDTPSVSTNSEAAARVKAAMAPLTDADFTPPGPPLQGTKSLNGKTVWFISLSDQITTMSILRSATTEALATVGVKLQSCDGKANPSAIAACASQAALNKADAVIFEGIDPKLISQQVADLNKQGIPVVTDNQPNPQGDGPGDKHWAFVPGVAHKAMVLLADWVTVDSGGKGQVIFNVVSDGGPSAGYVTDGFKPELAKQCPDCKLTLNEIQTSNFAKIPTVTSGALINNPKAEYVISEFDTFVDPTLQGIESAGRVQQVKGASTTGLLAQMQMVAGNRFLVADVGSNWSYQSYGIADQVLRLMTGAAPVDHDLPVRLFTKENIGDVTLTDAAYRSGEWYGSTGYKQMYQKLWKGQ